MNSKFTFPTSIGNDKGRILEVKISEIEMLLRNGNSLTVNMGDVKGREKPQIFNNDKKFSKYLSLCYKAIINEHQESLRCRFLIHHKNKKLVNDEFLNLEDSDSMTLCFIVVLVYELSHHIKKSNRKANTLKPRFKFYCLSGSYNKFVITKINKSGENITNFVEDKEAFNENNFLEGVGDVKNKFLTLLDYINKGWIKDDVCFLYIGYDNEIDENTLLKIGKENHIDCVNYTYSGIKGKINTIKRTFRKKPTVFIRKINPYKYKSDETNMLYDTTKTLFVKQKRMKPRTKKAIISLISLMALFLSIVLGIFFVFLSPNVVYINDEHLKQAINEQIEYSLYLSKDKAKNIKELDLSNKDIKNIESLIQFKNINTIKLKNNRIKDISVLEKFEKLKSVDITNNELNLNNKTEQGKKNTNTIIMLLERKIDVKYVEGNNPEIVIFKDPVFKAVIINELMNSIRKYPFDENIKKDDLKYINKINIESFEGIENILPDKYYNKGKYPLIEDITGIEYLQELQIIDLSNNNIQDIYPLTNLRKLKVLNLRDNKINQTDNLKTIIENNKNLNILYLGNNNDIYYYNDIRNILTERNINTDINLGGASK